MADIFAKFDGDMALPLERQAQRDFLTYRLAREAVPAGTEKLEICLDFLTAKAGDVGYYVVPSKSACFLMRFRQREDIAFANPEPLMTMFGAKKGDTAYLAVTDTMRFDYQLRTAVDNGVYTVTMVYDLTKTDLYEDIVLSVYPLTGDQADYNGIARRYRALQEEKLHLVPLAERAKTDPVIAYAADNMPIIRIRMGWKPVPTPVPDQTPENEPPMYVACTFADVEDLMEKMKAEGIEKAELCLVGWNRKGHDGRWPQIFPVEPELGGEEGLKQLTAHARRIGYRITCHTNNSDAYSVAECWDPEDIIREKDGKISVNNTYWSGGTMYNLCPKVAYEKYQPKDYEKMSALGFHGFHYIDVIAIVSPHTCFHPDHPLNAEETAGYINKTLARARATFGGAASEGGFDFAAENLDFALYVGFNMTQSLPPVADQVIPLWQLVYHGYIFSNPAAETVNYIIKNPINRLKFHEFGGTPSFYIHSKFVDLEEKNWMGTVDLYCGTEQQRIAAARQIQAELKDCEALAPRQLAFMDRYEEIAPGVFCTTYSDGYQVIANETEQVYSDGNVTVPAMGLVQVG